MTDINFFTIVLIGFLAQMIDGSLGMGFGTSSTTFLTTLGVPAKIASASVHTAELFTTSASGISHWKLENVNWALFKKLVIPGNIGSVIGAYTLVRVPVFLISPVVTVYLLVVGIAILNRGIRGASEKPILGRKLLPVGLAGGFFDALGGGGWGPIVTSTMVASGHPPRCSVGTVNTTEFFVVLVQVFTFTTLMGIEQLWRFILGLAIGGVIAAPFAASISAKVSEKKMLVAVGTLIIILNVRNLAMLIF